MTCPSLTVPQQLRSRLAGLVARFPYAVSALDRMGLSLFSFVLSLVLLRVLSTTEFGIVSLWMTLALFALDLQSALVNTPLNVHVPGAADAAAGRRLEGAAASVNVAVIAVVTLAVFAAVAGLAAIGSEFADVAIVVAIPLYVATGMYREYHRSLAFGRRDMSLLLWIDGPYLVVTTLCLGAMLIWRHQLASVAVAFFAMSLGSLVSQVWLHAGRNRDRPPLFAPGWLACYRTIIGEVAWSLVGVIASHVQGRSYVYIATSLAGLAALAAINVVNVLFRPLKLLVSAWSRSALPQMSALLASGQVADFDRTLRRAMAMALFGSIAWFLALYFAWHTVEHRLLAGRYPEARILLLPCAVASAVWLLESVASVGLVAGRQFKFLAHASMVCGVISAVATTAMILWQGYAAAMWGIAIGDGVCLAMQLYRLRQLRRRLSGAVDAAEAEVGSDYLSRVVGHET